MVYDTNVNRILVVQTRTKQQIQKFLYFIFELDKSNKTLTTKTASIPVATAIKSITTTIMRLVYRNRRAALLGTFCIFGVTMLLMKYTELGPTCLFKDDQQAGMMIRDEVSSLHDFYFF